MTDWYESLIDRQIREAQERGEFDDLPNRGKPLPDAGQAYHEDWWLRDLARREDLSGAAPATLRLKKDVEDFIETLAAQTTEEKVRNKVAELNEKILKARRGHMDGPAVSLPTFDVEQVVRRWREQRSQA